MQIRMIEHHTDLNLMNKEERQGLKLTKYQHKVLVGTLLGDSHLHLGKSSRNYHLMILHGFSQKAYTDWLYVVFRNWATTAPKIKNQLAKTVREFVNIIRPYILPEMEYKLNKLR